MADTFKVLYQGQLGSAVATLATVPALKQWIIKQIDAVNTDTSARTFGLCVNGTGAANRTTSDVISLPASGGFMIWDGMSITLNAGDTIAGGASVATKVTVTIHGDEIG
jgi:hypothetical protein